MESPSCDRFQPPGGEVGLRRGLVKGDDRSPERGTKENSSLMPLMFCMAFMVTDHHAMKQESSGDHPRARERDRRRAGGRGGFNTGGSLNRPAHALRLRPPPPRPSPAPRPCQPLRHPIARHGISQGSSGSSTQHRAVGVRLVSLVDRDQRSTATIADLARHLPQMEYSEVDDMRDAS